MDADVCKVLFVCGANSARSIMAETLLNRFGQGEFEAFSAGWHHEGEIDPLAVQTLRENGFDVSRLRAKKCDQLLKTVPSPFNFVISVCGANEAFRKTFSTASELAFWNITNPQMKEPEHRRRAFRRAFMELETRIKLFVIVNSRSSLRRRTQEQVQNAVFTPIDV